MRNLVRLAGPFAGSAIRNHPQLHIRPCGVPPRKCREQFVTGCGVEKFGANVNCLSMSDVSPQHSACDVAVIGGGPAGLAAAIALADAGANIALIARRAPYGDNRTTALLGGSVDFLRQFDVWRRCEDKAAALQGMRLVGDTGRLIRAPEVRFSSGEIDLDQVGFNLHNPPLK